MFHSQHLLRVAITSLISPGLSEGLFNNSTSDSLDVSTFESISPLLDRNTSWAGHFCCPIGLYISKDLSKRSGVCQILGQLN